MNSERFAASPVVVITNLFKRFGNFSALRDINADFSLGRMYAIVGDNGAGKTTLLRVLAGLTRPTSGTISMFGTCDLQSVRAQIGYMAHPSMVYDGMTGMENLRYFARLYAIPSDTRCVDAMRIVDLDPMLNRPAGKYSQGMRQRLSLARSLLNDPGVLLLDEPFSNVDAHSSGKMVNLLVRMRDEGKTIFVVTHQSALLDGVADEFIAMEGGRLAKRTRNGPAEQIGEARG